MRRGREAAKALGLGLLAGALALVAATRVYADAVLDHAAIENNGTALELHFGIRGRGLKWQLSGHGQELHVDLAHAVLGIAPLVFEGRDHPPVTLVRAVDYGAGHVRLVIEVSGKVDYAIGRLPHELVVRLAPTGAVPDVAAPLLVAMERARPASRIRSARRSPVYAAPAPPAEPPGRAASRTLAEADLSSPPIAPSAIEDRAPPPAVGPPKQATDHVAPDPLRTAALTPPQHRPVVSPLVVIDPGHGGYDPGTEAAGVVAEKDLTLQVAARLRQALASRGINAQLTRASDVFLSLADRTQLANRAGAALFISIHMNSSPDSATAGIETYYLNNTTDRATIRLAQMENGVAGGYSAPGGPNLNYILSDLRQGYKANESASLAQMIEAETVADVGASLGIRVNELGAKKGPFYVLVGADMPSVLVECGFLSNPGETRLLMQPRYQQALADGISAAVMHYFNADAAVGNL